MEKKIYDSPQIYEIKLDNEISLVLESDPPTFESNNLSASSDFFDNNVFRSANVDKV